MSNRHKRKDLVQGSGRGAPPARKRPRARARRRPRGRRGLLALLLLMALAASLAPTGQASGGRSAAAREALLAAKQTEREERIAAREAERALAKEQGRAGHRRPFLTGGPKDVAEKDHTKVTVDCTRVLWEFKEFSATELNTVKEVVTIRDQSPPQSMGLKYSFHGETATQETPIVAGPGRYLIDVAARWKSRLLKGGFDIHLKVDCPAEPALTIEKLQRIGGADNPFVSSPLTGSTGETVDYEMIVKNTGNVPLSLEDFSDGKCDEGTLSGGPAVGEMLAVGAATTYVCEHLLDAADETAKVYENTASVRGAPPEGDGSPVNETSNTVKVTVLPAPPLPAPALSVEKLQRIAGSGSFTTSQLSGHEGQKVEYEIVVTNSGNVPLTLTVFSDPHCDAGTIAGGPGGAALPAGASTTYTCSHTLDAEDVRNGPFYNTAEVTGTPPPGEGSPVSKTSNTVTVTLGPGPPAPGPGTPGSGTPGASQPAGSGGVLSSTSGKPASGVLAFISATAPRLISPQGCQRGGEARVSIKSASVQSVIFYLDGRKVRTLTAHSARNGLLTIEINTAKLSIGPHKLAAKITMVHPASVKATETTRRATLLRCDPIVVTPKFTG